MPGVTTRRVKLALATFFCFFGVVSVAQHYLVRHSVTRQVERLQGIIENISPSLSGVRSAASTHPKAWIFGNVSSHESWDQLLQAVSSEFGAEEAARIMSKVKVVTSSAQPAKVSHADTPPPARLSPIPAARSTPT